jgi:predicted ribosomally synthesized peptide with SipW-like signal peptide
MKSKRTLAVCAASALAVIMIVSATFAWFTAKDSVVNHLEAARITDGSASIVEIFTPPTDWVPGQTVTKQVSVANNGTGDVLVRVSFEEALSLLNVPAAADDNPIVHVSNASKIPQLFNTTAYASWSVPTVSSDFTAINGIPGGVTLKMQKLTAGGKDSYSFIALYEIPSGTYAGQYQRVTADFDVDGTELTVSNVKYWAFDGTTDTEAAWATFVEKQTGASATVRAATAIGSAITGDKIKLTYNANDKIVNATPQPDNWWYNAADGFFYYIGKLASGTISPRLLDSLTLDGSAGDSYSGMAFDLFVNLEAIQNTEAAITDSSGWNLTGQTDLINALKDYCE